MSPRPDRDERDRQSLRRRLDALRLPVVPLRRHGWVRHPADAVWRELGGLHEPVVGIGPDHDLVTYWSARRATGSTDAALTHTATGAKDDHSTVVVQQPPTDVSFAQPMPDGRFLLGAGRTQDGRESNASVWDHEGTRIVEGNLGDAIAHVLATPAGQIWIGYHDEANGPPSGPPSGIARFNPDLAESWRYRAGSGMPEHFDCYSLNVEDETATSYAYADWHLTRISGNSWTDLGRAPHIGAHGLLVEDERAVLIGGYGADYDLLTPVVIDGDGVHPTGSPRRLVLPDGLEVIRAAKSFCRGPELHVIHYGTWYRLSLSDI